VCVDGKKGRTSQIVKHAAVDLLRKLHAEQKDIAPTHAVKADGELYVED